MTCRDCVYSKVCPKAKHIENYHLTGGCSDFKNKEDFVEVVRCRDCKYSYFIKSCSKYECRKGCGILKYCNDFCSYGERKV